MNLPDRRRGHDLFHCEVCGKEITKKQSRLFRTCPGRKCRCEYGGRLRDRAKEFEQKHEQARQEFWRRIASKRDQTAKECGVPEPSKYLPVCVPHLKNELVAVSEERREKLRTNLRAILEQALDAAISDSYSGHEMGTVPVDRRNGGEDVAFQSSTNEDPTLLQAACSTCGGYCCQEGGEEAYLNAEKLGELLDTPDFSAESIVDEYLSRVPELSCRNSCIFHGSQGCALPRTMRSNLCNAFECYGLKRIREMLTDQPVRGLFIASTANEKVLKIRFVDSDADESEERLQTQSR